ncbi:MAG: hypothetical protein ACKV1O_16110 [Saprospiraceae bacterium]
MYQNQPNATILFLISNSAELSAEYRLFKITGMHPESQGFQKEKQTLIKRLSYKLKHPVTVIVQGDEDDKQAFLVTRNDSGITELVPEKYPKQGGNLVYFQDTGQVIELDFTSQDENTRTICQRFLQFNLQGQLNGQSQLWQPKTGHPFFLKKAEKRDGVATFTGFITRIIDLGREWAVCLDVTKKYVSIDPLPIYLTKRDFDQNFRKKNVLYPFGDHWYEINLKEWSDQTVSQYMYKDSILDRLVSIHEGVRARTPLPHSTNLANLPEDASTLIYYTEGIEPRGVPAGLCYEVFSTNDAQAARNHHLSILPPFQRVREVEGFLKNFLTNIRFGKTKLRIQPDPMFTNLSKFNFPDFVIGNNEILRLSDFNYSPCTIAKARMERLIDGKSGFLKPAQAPLGPQYLFLPRSIFDTLRSPFVQDLTERVKKMYPWSSYEPRVECYENLPSINASYVQVGRRIVESVKSKIQERIDAFAVVMIPEIGKAIRKHDQLAALVTNELRKSGIYVSIIHTSTLKSCFREFRNREGKTVYRLDDTSKGKYRGYIQNVALTKVLLLNNRFPFMLKTPLSADLTIGIDVKNNLAGFVFVDKLGHYIRSFLTESKQREKLTENCIKNVLLDQVKYEWELSGQNPFKSIVIHRDGRIFDTEERGIATAVNQLKKAGYLSSDGTVTILEIAKTSMVPIRILKTQFNQEKQRIDYTNPSIGTWFMPESKTAYLCTTGTEFRHPGTSNPLCVRYVSGEQPFEVVLRDVFYLSTLAFTKPDDCSRLPITTKLLDIRLRDQASEYDEEELQNSDWEESDLDEAIQNELSQI